MAENFSRVAKWYESPDSGSPATHKQVKQKAITIYTPLSKIAEYQRQRPVSSQKRDYLQKNNY